MRKSIKIIVVFTALVLTLSLGGCSLINTNNKSEISSKTEPAPSTMSDNQFVVGTTVDGIDISGKTLSEATTLCEEALKSKVSKTDITVKFEDDTVEIKGEDLVYTSIIQELLIQTLKSRKAGEYSSKYTFDSQKILEALEETAENHTVQPKDSTVKDFDSENETFSFTDAVDGKKVDLTKTVEAVVKQAITGESGTIEANMTVQPPTITADALKDKFIRISTYSTVSSNDENGNHNMQLSLEKINGTVLNSGEEFSFNQIVGDSTYDGSGFLPAGGLMGGVLVPMYGGGICQSSSTIYVAALKAGMDITLRDCHSSPSTYVPLGLDATVSYDDLDLKFRNPYESPIYLVGYMDEVTLTVSIYGCKPEDWDEIEVNSWETESEPVPDGVRFVIDDTLEKGEYRLKSDGNIGRYASAERIYYKNGDVVKTEELLSSYYDSMRKTYTVGPGTDTDALDL